MMKLLHQKILQSILPLLFLITAPSLWAQLTLPATSPYNENFNDIGDGLPEGWTVKSGATATAQGSNATLITAHVAWASTSNTGFRNSAASGTTNAASATNRALSLRASGSVGDPGGSFQLDIANTTGKQNFALSMKHQMLDAQPRSAIWSVQYSTNGTSWTTIGTYTDPGSTGSTNGSYSLGTGLDNKSGTVYIRIATLAGTSGSGNRDTYGIDDFVLSWTNTPVSPTITGNSTQNFTYGTAGDYTFTVANTTSITATLNPSGVLPQGITLNDVNRKISVAANTVPGTYPIRITATGSTSVTKDISLVVGKKTISIINAAVTTKEYNGNTAAIITGAVVDPAQIVGTDDISIDTVYLAEFNNTNAGTNKPVTTAFDLIGTEANRYILADLTTLTGSITAKELTISGLTAQNKEYDRTTPALLMGTPSLSGIVNTDDVTVNNSAVIANFISATTGNAKSVIVNGYTLSGTQAANYSVAQPSLSANITAKELSVTGVQIDNKFYDGTTTATITGTPALNGVIDNGGITDNVTLDASSATAVFTDANVNSAIPVTVSGYVLTGVDAFNYTLQQPQGLTANINDVTLQNQTITFNNLASATYGDAPFAVTATSTSTLPVSFSSSDTSVATVLGTTITIVKPGTTTITATQDGNATYNPAAPVTQELVVTTKTLTVSGAAVADKTYDKTTNAVVSGTLSGIVGTDVVTLTSAGTFTTDDAGNAISVTPQYVITGADVANYTLDQPVITGNILPVQLTLSTPSAANKSYDATNAAVITGTLSGILTGDTVTLSGTGTFDTVNKGTGIAVTSTATLLGADAVNYTLTQPTGLTADITSVAITVIATAQNKEYNRTTDATITINQVNGVILGDDVSVTGNGTFNTYNAGINKTVTANLTLTGASAANYTLTQPMGLTAAITAKTITVDTTNTTVTPKTYDGLSVATLTNTTLTGIVAGDENDVNVSTATFTQVTPGTGIPVSNFILSGTAAGNYTLTQPATITGNILHKELTIIGTFGQNKIYDGNTTASVGGVLFGIVGNDVVTLTLSGTYTSEDVANGITITSTSTISGADAANYTLAQPTGITGNITPKTLTILANGQNKVYDKLSVGTVINGQISSSEVISGDAISLVSSSVTGSFNNTNVGSRTINALFALQGTDAANYKVVQQTFQADITPLALTADITNTAPITKVYNNTNIVVISGIVLNGVLTGDLVNAITGEFASVNVGENIPVTISLSGGSSSNYTITQPVPSLTGTITKKLLTITAVNKTKVQGAVNPALTYSTNGFVSGENEANAAGYTAPALNTTAQTASPAGAYAITLTGGTADNYQINLVNGWLLINAAPGANATILAWDFTDEQQLATSTAELIDSKLTSNGLLTRGSAAAGSAGTNSFRTIGFKNDGIAVTNNDYFQFTIAANNSNLLSLSSISAELDGTMSFAVAVSHQFAYSTNGTTFTLIGTPTVTSGQPTSINVNVSGVTALQNIPTGTTVTIRYYASGNTSTGGWGFKSATAGVYGLSVNGAFAPAPTSPIITSALTGTSVIGATDTYQITATGSPVVTFTAANLPTGGTLNNSGLITFDGTTPAGIYNIGLTATSYYGTNTKTLVYTVAKKDQALTFNPDPIPTKFLSDAAFTVSVTNTAPLAVTLSSSDTAVATIDQNGLITMIGVGTTTITAANTGDLTYNAISAAKTFTVLATPVITATPTSMAFNAIQGQGPSAATQLTQITGNNLVPASGTITLTASSGFEIAMGIGAYSSTATFNYNAGSFTETNPQLFVRFAAGSTVGNYTGTLIIDGGSASLAIPLTATVELAPAITTTASTYGDYCSGTQNTISVAYTTQGTFGAGNFYVQHSDALGAFPSDFTNIISAASTASPISATLPSTIVAGNYRVRVLHLSSAPAITSSITNNGSDIIVHTTPAPTASALAFCNAATVAQLTATGTDLKWYVAATGGTALNATTALATGNYYVSQTLNTCESTRTMVAVTINTTPAPTASALAFCNAATVAQLTATGTDLKWYAAATGGTALTATTALATGNYYVSQTLNTCESTRTMVAVTINTTPAPTASAQTFITGATASQLTATGTDLKWYTTATGGTQVNSTLVLVSGSYYVSQTLNGCESARTEIIVTITNPIPAAPAASNQAACNGSLVSDLNADGENLKWYITSTGGNALAETTVLTSATYYVSQTVGGYESNRTQVTVTITVTPVPTANNLTFCQAATVTELTATGTDLKWYAAATGGTALTATTTLATGNYYVSQTIEGCESARIAVVVIVTSTPVPTASNQTFCQGASVEELSATALGINLKWYSSLTADATLPNETLLETATYYVSQTANGCESVRKAVQVTINVTAAPTGESQQIFTEEGKTIANLEVDGENIKWYATEEDAIDGTNAIDTTTLLISGATYYATQTLNGCESKIALAVTVEITLGREDFEKFTYKYYPNPVIEQLTIEASETITNVSVYSLTGQQVINQKWNTMNGTVNLSALEANVYIVKINFSDVEKTIKVVKTKQ